MRATKVLRRQRATAAAVRQTFQNWIALLAVVFLSKYLGVRTREFTAVTRDGIAISSPGWEAALWPMIEVFATDDYRLKRFDLAAPRILDIGAHIGAFTLAASHAFQGARCVAYEPAPDTFTYLEKNILANKLCGRVEVRSCAVTGAGQSV